VIISFPTSISPEAKASHFEGKILRMKRWLTVLLLSSFICVFAFSQAEANSATQTSVCEIVRQPEQFEGKLLKVTAQIWTDYHQFWLNAIRRQLTSI
jgi:hypothetical protein